MRLPPPPRWNSSPALPSAPASGRLVPQGLFRRARGLRGDAGIAEPAALLGWFTAVCPTLTAFDVPANAVGLDQ